MAVTIFSISDGLVLHRPVAIQVSKELSKDFLATLPKGLIFKKLLHLLDFKYQRI